MLRLLPPPSHTSIYQVIHAVQAACQAGMEADEEKPSSQAAERKAFADNTFPGWLTRLCTPPLGTHTFPVKKRAPAQGGDWDMAKSASTRVGDGSIYARYKDAQTHITNKHNVLYNQLYPGGKLPSGKQRADAISKVKYYLFLEDKKSKDKAKSAYAARRDNTSVPLAAAAPGAVDATAAAAAAATPPAASPAPPEAAPEAAPPEAAPILAGGEVDQNMLDQVANNLADGLGDGAAATDGTATGGTATGGTADAFPTEQQPPPAPHTDAAEADSGGTELLQSELQTAMGLKGDQLIQADGEMVSASWDGGPYFLVWQEFGPLSDNPASQFVTRPVRKPQDARDSPRAGVNTPGSASGTPGLPDGSTTHSAGFPDSDHAAMLRAEHRELHEIAAKEHCSRLQQYQIEIKRLKMASDLLIPGAKEHLANFLIHSPVTFDDVLTELSKKGAPPPSAV